jgi:nitrous oxidase accessory protein
VHIDNNTIAGNRGPSGFGIGLKDMDDAVISNNLIIDNRVGTHMDTSPREVDSTGQFTGNVYAYNDIGVQMMPAVRRNYFTGNSFIENSEQVAVAGGGLLKGNVWTVEEQGNFWSDYAGYDADTDGAGDIIYKSERLFEDLMQREPELRLFVHSPAVNALDFAAKAFPSVRPQPKLEDSLPMMSPIIPANTPALPQTSNPAWYGFAIGLITLAAGIVFLPRLHQQQYTIAPQELETIE